jgi:hypothetical protein
VAALRALLERWPEKRKTPLLEGEREG